MEKEANAAQGTGTRGVSVDATRASILGLRIESKFPAFSKFFLKHNEEDTAAKCDIPVR